MNTKTKGIVAGVAGAALLLGAGGTFALWHDEGQVAGGGVIRAGHLKVVAEDTRWFDVSPRPRRRPGPHERGRPEPALGRQLARAGADAPPHRRHDPVPHRRPPDDTGSGTGGVVGHPIDLPTWQAVPGDFVLGQTQVMAHTEGDNMDARLSVHGLSAGGDLAQGLGLKFFVTDRDGNVMAGAHDVSEATDLHLPGGRAGTSCGCSSSGRFRATCPSRT